MIDLSKSYDFFQPEKDESRIHIIGCGSVGSTIAENLARCGVKNMVLWDFDTVEPHNIVNQMYRQQDVGKLKVEALKDILCDIDPELSDTIDIKSDGWQGNLMSGYIFLCVDNIELRKEIVEKHMDSPFVKAVFDIRTMLTGAQHYAAPWNDYTLKRTLLKSMQFTHEEATAETPVSACGVTLGIVTTVRLICAICVNNYIKFVKGEKLWKFCQIDGFSGILDCFN